MRARSRCRCAGRRRRPALRCARVGRCRRPRPALHGRGGPRSRASPGPRAPVGCPLWVDVRVGVGPVIHGGPPFGSGDRGATNPHNGARDCLVDSPSERPDQLGCARRMLLSETRIGCILDASILRPGSVSPAEPLNSHGRCTAWDVSHPSHASQSPGTEGDAYPQILEIASKLRMRRGNIVDWLGCTRYVRQEDHVRERVAAHEPADSRCRRPTVSLHDEVGGVGRRRSWPPQS